MINQLQQKLTNGCWPQCNNPSYLNVAGKILEYLREYHLVLPSLGEILILYMVFILILSTLIRTIGGILILDTVTSLILAIMGILILGTVGVLILGTVGILILSEVRIMHSSHIWSFIKLYYRCFHWASWCNWHFWWWRACNWWYCYKISCATIIITITATVMMKYYWYDQTTPCDL